MDDSQLLRAYIANASQEVFTELVRRHIDLVYAAALRQTRDHHLAEDVTQAVFIILERKARSLRDPSLLSGWLVGTTRHAALNALKYQTRRRHHEQQAAAMKQTQTPSSSVDVAPLIDQALASLSGKDRSAIALRYLQGKSVRDVGAAMGISEDAAQKRIGRALEKMRGRLFHANIEEILTHSSAAAPASLLAAIAGGTSSASAGSIAAATLKTLSLSSAKLAAGICAAGLIVVAGSSVLILKSQSVVQANTPPATIVPIIAPTSSPTIAATTAPAPTTPALKTTPLPNVTFLMNDSSPDFSRGLDAEVTRTGVPSVTVIALNPKSNLTGSVTRGLDVAALRGQRIRVTAFLKTKDVIKRSALRLIVLDAAKNILSRDDDSQQFLTGTTDWKQVEVVTDIPQQADQIYVSLQLLPPGQVWMDGAQVEIVGKNIPLHDDSSWHLATTDVGVYTASVDPAVQRDGHATVCVTASKAPASGWGWWGHGNRDIGQYRGKRVRMTVWIKTENATGGCGPNMIDRLGTFTAINTDTRNEKKARGTTDWNQYEASIDVRPETHCLDSGITLHGNGKMWLDDMQYEIVGDASVPPQK